jgi:hypothetical protein
MVVWVRCCRRTKTTSFVVVGLAHFVVLAPGLGWRCWCRWRQRRTRWHCGRRSRNHGGGGFHLGRVTLVSLLLEQIITGKEEGGQQLTSGEDRDGMTELGVQATQSVDNHGWIRDGMTHIAQQIDEVLEAVEVVVDGQLALELLGK